MLNFAKSIKIILGLLLGFVFCIAKADDSLISLSEDGTLKEFKDVNAFLRKDDYEFFKRRISQISQDLKKEKFDPKKIEQLEKARITLEKISYAYEKSQGYQHVAPEELEVLERLNKCLGRFYFFEEQFENEKYSNITGLVLGQRTGNLEKGFIPISGYSSNVAQEVTTALLQLKHLKALHLWGEKAALNFKEIGKLESLEFFSAPSDTSDKDLMEMRNLPKIKFLVLHSCEDITGEFIETLPKTANLYAIMAEFTEIKLDFLEKLMELPTFFYIKVASNKHPFKWIQLPKEQIADYVKEAKSLGYVNTGQISRINREKSETKIIGKNEITK